MRVPEPGEDRRGSGPVIITVDRSVQPRYPEWAVPVHPELESVGPSRYDLTKVIRWLHEDQKNGSLTHAQTIYDYLKVNGLFGSCLGLSDANAICMHEKEEIQRAIGCGLVFFWRSVVMHRVYRTYHIPAMDVGSVGPLGVCMPGFTGSHWSGMNIGAAHNFAEHKDPALRFTV